MDAPELEVRGRARGSGQGCARVAFRRSTRTGTPPIEGRRYGMLTMLGVSWPRRRDLSNGDTVSCGTNLGRGHRILASVSAVAILTIQARYSLLIRELRAL